MTVERDELALVWPSHIFKAEGQALLDAGADSERDVGYLLDEAFQDHRAFRLWQQLDQSSTAFAWDDPLLAVPDGYRISDSHRDRPTRALLQQLVSDADSLPHYTQRRYYRQRHQPIEPAVLSPAELRSAWADKVTRLAYGGFFDDAFGSSCTDAREDPDAEGQQRLQAMLQVTEPLWPLSVNGQATRYEQSWSKDLFYDVVEALHDVVARPRARHYHDYCDAWHHSDFARVPGKAIYRWTTNQLLARSESPLRMAESGEDAGQLVRAVGDPRDELTAVLPLVTSEADADEVTHAIGLFRARDASRQDKRSSIVALARVLESKRPLLHGRLRTKDAAALFEIANRFDLRHRRADQLGDYDDVYLDWIFWWYLATVELATTLAESPLAGPRAGK